MSNLKIRKIILIIIIVIWLVSTLLGILSTISVSKYLDWVVDSAKITIQNRGSILSKVGLKVVVLLVLIFPIVFLYISKIPNTQTRKWPYITLLVLSILGFIISLYSIWSFLDSNYAFMRSGMRIDNIESPKNAAIRSILNTEWNLHYNSANAFYTFVGPVISISLIGLYIMMLIMIKKSKDERANKHSHEMKEFGENMKKSGSKRSKENKSEVADLP